MLNVPTAEHPQRAAQAEEEDAQQNQSHELQRRRLRRRPLSGDRVQGWADVRKLEQDGTGVEKYQVNLNTTAQLNWTEWQLMCDAEPTETMDATWCIIPGDANDDDDEDEDDEQEEDTHAMDTTDSTAGQSDTQDGEQTRNQRASSAGSNSSAGTRFVRRRSASPHGESVGDSPRES